MAEQKDQVVNLQNQVQALQNDLAKLKTNNQVIWGLLVRIGNRLQRSSTAIKTAVSSLLDYDIFWDETTQYEFLQAIDSSTDELAHLIVLITLAFRSQAKTLEIETEPNALQEILVNFQSNLAKNDPQIQLDIHYPSDGRAALVDYRYLSLALGLLIEVIFSEEKETKQIFIQASENSNHWRLRIGYLNSSLATIIRHFFKQADDIAAIVDQILPENALKLMTACRILYLQQINLCNQTASSDPTIVCLQIPVAPQSVSNE